MAELGDFLVSGDTTVNIDVEMLDYGFIEKCDDAKTLRGIIDTLKSGKEGIYPEVRPHNALAPRTYSLLSLTICNIFLICAALPSRRKQIVCRDPRKRAEAYLAVEAPDHP
jgi:hypothetical protein